MLDSTGPSYDEMNIEGVEQRILRLKRELHDAQALLAKKREVALAPPPPVLAQTVADAPVTTTSSPQEKIALFRRLFAGRTDVFPLRWENAKKGTSGYSPACANEWVRQVCRKPQVKCRDCPNQAFINVSDDIIEQHLRGTIRPRAGAFVMGVYPLLHDDTCWFLAADFDDEDWAVDALAYMQTCRVWGIPAALERSRSGAGGHVWIFFSGKVSARDARQLGAALLTETMERRPEIRFTSYDRFFPNQDIMPNGKFGNLIALPLQRQAKADGNSLFVDDDLQPYKDQWAFLSTLPRMSPEAVSTLVRQAERQDRVIAVRMPVEEENAEQPWLLSPSRRQAPAPITEPLPNSVDVRLADEVYIDRSQLPAVMVTRLIRLAAFQNPEFYRAQAMRMPTYDKPRIISCANLHPTLVSLPRGCLDESLELLRTHGIESAIIDHRETGDDIPFRFIGKLHKEQQAAVKALEAYDTGVLAATTGFGKTVVAAALIARRGCSTLVLVHRRELLTQWIERLSTFLGLERKEIGVIGGGRRKPTGHIDVALIQSLVRKGEVSDLISGYGQLIVDECHHLSARSFELVTQRSKARYVLGLSATVTRKDGHHPIIFMQCGPVRYRVDLKAQAARRSFEHIVRLHETSFILSPFIDDTKRSSMASIYAELARDEQRNALIHKEVADALENGRSPLVLTQRREHIEALQARFEQLTPNVIVLHGGMGARERRRVEEHMRASQDEKRILLATGRYLGEGFDDPRLDTLFLTAPISWKGTLAQYVGRLHREHDGKSEVVVHDYVDVAVPFLARMANKRQAGYRALGYALR
jgi:superfamily II DNA or RNA helicase